MLTPHAEGLELVRVRYEHFADSIMIDGQFLFNLILILPPTDDTITALASNACVYTNLTNREISVTGNLPLLVGAKLPKPLIDRTIPVRLRPAKQRYFSC